MAKEIKNQIKVVKQFPVIGIGASAGGLEAMKLFLSALPARSGMAYIFAQHLSATHTSIMPELLEKISPVPVKEISHQMQIEVDHLYIMPKEVTIKVADNKFLLEVINRKIKKPNTIDILFSSLGSVYESFAVGIVLSGALNDGTLGLQVIKTYGGITFAQDEASAGFESMPHSAISMGVVDFVLPPAQIAEKLIAINQPFHGSAELEGEEIIPQEDEDVFRQILTIMRARRGVDFQYYKSSTLKRRIIRRMALSKSEKTADYLYQLRESKAEQEALYHDLLISVTNFFRDPPVFSTICNELLPALISQKEKKDEPLRIWVAGCATGEEAYTLAICLQEYFGDNAVPIKLQIFATDISEIAIAKARAGLYRHNDLSGLSPARIEKYFTKLDGHYQVHKSIREMCVFAYHNLLKDPPFSKIDLVSCRNVLIYFEPVLQKRAMTTFHYALNNGGYLMLGKSETIGNQTDIFSPYLGSEKIYQRKGPPGRFMTVTTTLNEETFRRLDSGIKHDEVKKDIFKLADEIMLVGFMPPGVMLNDKYDIIQFRGDTQPWLSPPQGKPSFNILKMARDGLAYELRSLLTQAKTHNLTMRKFGFFYTYQELQHFVNLQVVPIKDGEEQFYLVVFQAASSTGIQPSMFDIGMDKGVTEFDAAQLRIEHLERELIQSRADMRVVSDEQEAVNEELQSTNEELLSGSEELQSLNEELETSKEELQSTNEEITVMNTELLDRNEQLNNARLYGEGIVNTIRDPLLILNNQLQVVKATEGFYKKFNVSEKDTEGKYIYELGNHQWDIPILRTLLEGVLPQKKELKDFEVKHDFPVLGEKIMLLNARKLNRDQHTELILLAIEDITNVLKIQKTLPEIEVLKLIISTEGVGTWSYDPISKMISYDNVCGKLLGIRGKQINLQNFLEKFNQEDQQHIQQYFISPSTKKRKPIEGVYNIQQAGHKTTNLKINLYFMNQAHSLYSILGTIKSHEKQL